MECVAGYVCRREMSDEPNDGVAINMDVDSARPWYQEHVGGTEQEFQKVIVEAEDALLKDLKDTLVRAGVLAEAKRFEKEIFPAPKLTSGLLRARRLGWTHNDGFPFRRAAWDEARRIAAEILPTKN
jgi:hypothetical protein